MTIRRKQSMRLRLAYQINRFGLWMYWRSEAVRQLARRVEATSGFCSWCGRDCSVPHDEDCKSWERSGANSPGGIIDEPGFLALLKLGDQGRGERISVSRETDLLT